MANKVRHVQLGIEIDLNKSVEQTLWDKLYAEDRENAKRHVPVSQRGLMCAGICKDAGVTAWMYLRERNGRREAVHERAEDEARHSAPMTDEHKAYQERIVRVAQAEGFQADCEVRTRTGGRAWISTDTMVACEGRRIGWEIQLSTIEHKGPKSVRARAAKATANNITPAWHTDRPNYSQRNDAHWTACNHFNAPEIRTNPIRIVSGFRAWDFWRCEVGATLLCPNNITDSRKRCGKVHLTPKPRDILFDDMVRNTATGLVVPVEHRMSRRVHRFWVTRDDQRRLYDFAGGPVPEDQSSGADKAVGRAWVLQRADHKHPGPYRRRHPSMDHDCHGLHRPHPAPCWIGGRHIIGRAKCFLAGTAQSPRLCAVTTAVRRTRYARKRQEFSRAASHRHMCTASPGCSSSRCRAQSCALASAEHARSTAEVLQIRLQSASHALNTRLANKIRAITGPSRRPPPPAVPFSQVSAGTARVPPAEQEPAGGLLPRPPRHRH